MATSWARPVELTAKQRIAAEARKTKRFFITLSFPDSGDTQAPVISNVDAVAATTSAQVLWNTDENSNSVVYFGTTTPVDTDVATKIESASLVTNHSLVLSNLATSTTYHYIVASTDGAGNTATSTEYSFETLAPSPPADTTAPILSNIAANATTTEATITWNTDEDADSAVFYSATTPVDTDSADKVEDASFVESHEQTLSSLMASTTYYYLIVSTDESGNTATSTEHLFETPTQPEPADTTAPVISNITVKDITGTEATIEWSTDEEADSRAWYGTTTPFVLIDAVLQLDTTLTLSHSLSLFGLISSTTYYYIVTSSDLLGNTATSTEQTFTAL